MNVVKFPGFNLILNVTQFAFEIAGIKIYNYAICIVLGIIVALMLCRLNKTKYEIEFDEVLEYMIYALIMGIIGARIYYILFNLEYYKNNVSQILNFRDGGLAIYGGLILAIVSFTLTVLVFIKYQIKQVLADLFGVKFTKAKQQQHYQYQADLTESGKRTTSDIIVKKDQVIGSASDSTEETELLSEVQMAADSLQSTGEEETVLLSSVDETTLLEETSDGFMIDEDVIMVDSNEVIESGGEKNG